MTNLQLDDVSKIYAGTREPAVDRVSMEVEDSEIIALLGSSGCGKTSTLRMIAGFENVTSGAIRLGNTVINGLKPAQRNVAMAFEGYALYPPLTVHDNIAFSLLKHRIPGAEIERRVNAVSDMLEIGPLLNRYPPSISGGQQQRVSLARALIRNDASAYLLDEPMSQLEPQLRALLRARIKDHMLANRMTTVIVTHDQTEAMALSDRVAVMDKGVLQQYGTPEELRERPANLFVASFIGEPPMNMFRGQCSDGELVVFDERGAVAFRLPGNSNALAGIDRIQVGIRPHKIHPGMVLPDAAIVHASVLSVHWLGDHTHIGLDVGGSFLIAVGDRDARLPVGEVIPVSIPSDAIHLFDDTTGIAVSHGL